MKPNIEEKLAGCQAWPSDKEMKRCVLCLRSSSQEEPASRACEHRAPLQGTGSGFIMGLPLADLRAKA